MPPERLPVFAHSAIDDLGLSPSAFRVYARICRRWSEERGCDEAADSTAEACRLNRKTVFDARRELAAEGLIRITPRPGQTTRIDVVSLSDWLENRSDGDGNPSPQTEQVEDNPSPQTERVEEHPSPQTEQVPAPSNGTGSAEPVPSNGSGSQQPAPSNGTGTRPLKRNTHLPPQTGQAYKGSTIEGSPKKGFNKHQHHHETDEGRARGTDNPEAGDDAVSSKNDFGLSGETLQAARQLYAAGVDGRGGAVAQKLTADHGAEVVRRQLKNLQLRQQSGNGPRSPGAWLVEAVRGDYDLPGDDPPDPSRQKQRPTGQDQVGRPPEHQPGPSRQDNSQGEPMSDDVKAQVEDTLQRCDEIGDEKAARQRERRSRKLGALRRQRFKAHFHTGRFALEELASETLLQPPL
jgi:hypothetical protein